MSRRTHPIYGAILSMVIGLLGALLLAHFAACEAFDSFCAFTGEDSK